MGVLTVAGVLPLAPGTEARGRGAVDHDCGGGPHAPNDLWGELPLASSRRPPLSIIREQAEILTRRTGGRLVGRVETSLRCDEFHHTLLITVPVLGEYAYDLLTAKHGALLYPGSLSGAGMPAGRFDDEAMLCERLRTILQATATRRVVEALLAQIRASEAGLGSSDSAPV